jgi:hypothetical protein
MRMTREGTNDWVDSGDDEDESDSRTHPVHEAVLSEGEDIETDGKARGEDERGVESVSDWERRRAASAAFPSIHVLRLDPNEKWA